MQADVLRTKVTVPPLRPKLVPRPQLRERLNRGLQAGHKLTLIAAPAGFGKTTLIGEWLSGCEWPAAWLSLDEADDELTRFLTYLITALQTLPLRGVDGSEVEGNAPAIGEGALAGLQSAQQPPTESILTALVNEIIALPDHFILVLDDYHFIDTQAIDEALTFLLDHLPPQMHLVIASREDPPVPLSRLRVRDQLTELRAADLRFSADEAATFLNQIMGLTLTAAEIESLETRTEGWIAGLQLAAISMQGRDDTAAFIQAFAGSHHYVLDYLAEEVLQRQPEHVRSFLINTSILERLSGSLCDAVTGQEDGKEMLAALERANLFVIALDDSRLWYRYHHLFADVLRAHTLEEVPDQVPLLHRRASEWYEENSLPASAIRHALAAARMAGAKSADADWAYAAGLIELAWPAMDESFQSKIWLGWAKALPETLVRDRPVLCVAFAWAVLTQGELEAAETWLREAEHWLDEMAIKGLGSERPATRMVVVDEDQFRSLPASVATAHTFMAQARGDLATSEKYAKKALDLIPENDYVRRGPAAALLGLAYWRRGELEAAHETLAEAMDGFRLAGSISFAISGTYGLADIRMAQGRLRAAFSTYEASLKLVREQGDAVIRGTADLYLGLSALHHERGEQGEARRNLLRSEELGERAALGDWPYRSRIVMARFKESEGDPAGALDLLDEAQRLYYSTPVPNVRPIDALKARVWLAQGRVAEALAWARERGLSAADELSYLREFEHMILARIRISQYESSREKVVIDEAAGLLERLLQAAEDGGRMGSVMEILVMQALADQAQGDIPAALKRLERALALAEPEGYVRLFIDEGRPMARLLREAAKAGLAVSYVSRLQQAFGKGEEDGAGEQRLPEPLSERELEVLRLLATELSGPEIARELMVSLNTMRTHTKNIYSKLGANNRRAAVRRAEELNLL